ncbi:ABC transporter permease [Marinisporobacter balticus]|uniref:Autoinducer 2 import system permease protein LsrC n=1 Tax=Marinisporobacter balticus TaxID=2018667 RepID=A0A4R2KQ20_9FIRM|nr:ABC transporter permease [Marinisporobacter balticus]TCO74767.1 monosaccharide ABC transporter membrane protein (CUT2 family) [Marinisporobacter balticus]
MTIIKRIFEKREITALAFLIILFLGVGLRNPDFMNTQSISTVLKGSVLYIFLAVGMTFVLLTGGIDVSVGATLGISAAISASMIRDGSSVVLSILLAIAIGLIIGLINGIGVAIIKVPAIIMTLGVLGITRGTMIVYTNGKWVENLPDSFKVASQANLGGLNFYFILAVIIVALVQLYFSRGKTGRFFAAIGDNVEGSILVGIPVKKITVIAYVASGFCASVAGVIFASQVGFVTSNTGLDIEMVAIAACVLGGVSLSGGIGSVIGASIGAIIMTAINSALIFLKVPSFWNKSIQGSLLILIVVSDVLIHKYFQDKARKQRLSARSSFVGGDK